MTSQLAAHLSFRKFTRGPNEDKAEYGVDLTGRPTYQPIYTSFFPISFFMQNYNLYLMYNK